MDHKRDTSSVLRIMKLIEDGLEEERDSNDRKSSEDLMELIRAAQQLSRETR